MTLSGAQGGNYGGAEGGCGITLTKTIWLKEGTEISGTAGIEGYREPEVHEGNMNIYGGGESFVLIGDQKTVAGGGGASINKKVVDKDDVVQVNVYSGSNAGFIKSTDVHYHSKASDPSRRVISDNFGTIYNYNSPGGCYRGSHTCNTLFNCMTVVNYGTRCACKFNDAGECIRHKHRCKHCNSADCSGKHRVCNNSRINTWKPCSYSHGQIFGLWTSGAPVVASTSACSGAEGWSDSADNQGNGKFTIELVEQNNLSYKGIEINLGKLGYEDPDSDIIYTGKVPISGNEQVFENIDKRVNVVLMHFKTGEKSNNGTLVEEDEEVAVYVKHGNLN